MKIYHNPRCSKSRQTLALLEENGIIPEIILYLQDKPTKDDIQGILSNLGIPAEKLIRKGEQIFKDNFKGKTLSEDEWVAAMVEYPKLIERPIVIKGDKAVLGRPPQNVLDLINH